MKVNKETRDPQQGDLFILQEPLILKAVRRVCPETKRDLYYELKKGEIVEFRYHSPCHFRTKDGIFFSLPQPIFLGAFKLWGQVWDDIRFKNQHTLDQILYAKLYNLVEEGAQHD